MQEPTKRQRRKNTRARAERAISHGADPALYLSHPNKHVRAKAVRKLRGAS